jgi:hypothetical protein
LDDINELGEDDNHIVLTDQICRAFEAASGAILNRNRKTVVLGLGSWAGRRDWPLPWLQAVDQAKVLGVVVTPVCTTSVSASWELVVAGVERVLLEWAARRLPTLRRRARALDTFALSKAWYLAQILPMPATVAIRLCRAVSDFLWRGRMEHLAFEELHSPFSEGGLRLSTIDTRAQALAKQACHRLAAAHIVYWMGLRLRDHLPALGGGVPTPRTYP